MNHAIVARRLVKAVENVDAATPVATVTALLNTAQVHATLALVEQQRVANLIAYAAHRIEHRSALGSPDYPDALRKLLSNADFSIREGLDIS